MTAVVSTIEAWVSAVPLPVLEVWGQAAYLVGFGLAVLAFGGFTLRPRGRLGLGREQLAWDARAVVSIPITFIAIRASTTFGTP